MGTLAVVLAGGLGTRLRPVVSGVPKCLTRVGGKPFLEHVLGYVRTQGVRKVVLAVGYRGDQIRAHFGSGESLGLRISYSDDGPRLRGTGGAIAHALRNVSGSAGEQVLIINGDTLAPFSLQELVEKRDSTDARLVLVGARVDDVTRYGRFELGPGGEVLRFLEKGDRGAGIVSAGVYFGNRGSVVRCLPRRQTFSIERDVLPKLAGRGLYAVLSSGFFMDIGLPESYREANVLLSRTASN